MQQTDFLTKDKILNEYADVFDGLGRMEGQLHLRVDETVSPTVMPPRRLPIAVKGKVKEELARLENAGVLKKVEEPTDWVSSMVVTAKSNGRVRICIDPTCKQLNQAPRRSHYPLPVIEDVLPDLAKARVFSKADVKGGFLQIELDEKSSMLTTFQTPWGRYRCHSGFALLQNISNRSSTKTWKDLWESTRSLIHDLLITGQGDTPEEADHDHDNNLRQLLKRCREKNIKLNKAKFTFKSKEVSFIGHILTKDGLKPDPNKVRTIVDMDRPTDVQGVQRLIGLVKYLSKFLKHLSELCKPLRQLTHKDTEWNWTHEQEEAFMEIKRAVTQTPVLKYFNPSEPTEGQGDA